MSADNKCAAVEFVGPFFRIERQAEIAHAQSSRCVLHLQLH